MSRRITTFLLAFGLAAACLASANAQLPPQSWSLDDVTPDPFCIDIDGVALFSFNAPQAARFLFQIWSPDSTQAVATLFETAGSAGSYLLFWYGEDGEGVRVDDGDYPYTLIAWEVGGPTVLFEASKRFTVFCPAAVEERHWSHVKQMFR